MLLVSSCSCFCTIHWYQVLSREWTCSWSSADMLLELCCDKTHFVGMFFYVSYLPFKLLLWSKQKQTRNRAHVTRYLILFSYFNLNMSSQCRHNCRYGLIYAYFHILVIPAACKRHIHTHNALCWNQLLRCDVCWTFISQNHWRIHFSW